MSLHPTQLNHMSSINTAFFQLQFYLNFNLNSSNYHIPKSESFITNKKILELKFRILIFFKGQRN